jgi:hypothetical protein
MKQWQKRRIFHDNAILLPHERERPSCYMTQAAQEIPEKAPLWPTDTQFWTQKELSKPCKGIGSMGESRLPAVFKYRFPHVRRLSHIPQRICSHLADHSGRFFHVYLLSDHRDSAGGAAGLCP